MLDSTLTDQTQAFLDAFGDALEKRDVARAREMFLDDCYWRDLVAFTWNIKTVEGKDQIEDMLRSQLDSAAPSGWRIAEGELPAEEDGVVTAWIQFETATGRGYGLVRLRDGKIWTLLTTLAELKGHEEPKGFARPLGAKHGAAKHRPTWKEEREAEARELGYTRQPYTVIVGGGQGGIALGARLRQLGVPTIIVEKNDRPGDSWRPALQVALPARPGLVRPPSLHQVPRELAGVRPEGQDRRLARVLHEGDGAQLLVPHRLQVREIRRGEEGMDRRGRSRRRGGDAAAEAARPRHGHGRESR